MWMNWGHGSHQDSQGCASLHADNHLPLPVMNALFETTSLKADHSNFGSPLMECSGKNLSIKCSRHNELTFLIVGKTKFALAGRVFSVWNHPCYCYYRGSSPAIHTHWWLFMCRVHNQGRARWAEGSNLLPVDNDVRQHVNTPAATQSNIRSFLVRFASVLWPSCFCPFKNTIFQTKKLASIKFVGHEQYQRQYNRYSLTVP
jgi:hypothetical protein